MTPLMFQAMSLEATIQRLREMVAFFQTSVRDQLEEFWEMRWAKDHKSPVQNSSTDANGRLLPLYDIRPADISSAIEDLRKQSLVLANYQEHRDLIDTALTRGDNLVLIGHNG